MQLETHATTSLAFAQIAHTHVSSRSHIEMHFVSHTIILFTNRVSKCKRQNDAKCVHCAPRLQCAKCITLSSQSAIDACEKFASIHTLSLWIAEWDKSLRAIRKYGIKFFGCFFFFCADENVLLSFSLSLSRFLSLWVHICPIKANCHYLIKWICDGEKAFHDYDKKFKWIIQMDSIITERCVRSRYIKMHVDNWLVTDCDAFYENKLIFSNVRKKERNSIKACWLAKSFKVICILDYCASICTCDSN